MPRKVYTMAVLLCALSWLLVGLHVPALHTLSHPAATRRWLPLGLLAVFLVLAIADTWTLLRAAAQGPVAGAEPPAA